MLVFLFFLIKKETKKSSTAWSLRVSVQASASPLSKVQRFGEAVCLANNGAGMMLMDTDWVELVAFGLKFWTA